MVSGRKINLRRRARQSLTRIAALAGVLQRLERRMRDGWTILTYHRVLGEAGGYPFPALVTPVEMFRQQVRWLSERCEVVTIAEAVRMQEAGRTRGNGRPLVSVTFDDGYVDGVDTAAGILEEYGVRGTFFVTAGPVGSTSRLWFDVAARRFRAASARQVREAIGATLRSAPATDGGKPALGEWMRVLKTSTPDARGQLVGMLPRAGDEEGVEGDRLMRPEELRRLAASGHEVGSHTVRHPILPRLSDAELDEEVRGARERIGAWLGGPPAGFCYPNGDHDERVVAAVRRAGYAYACTTRAGRNDVGSDRMRLARIDMNPGRVTGRDGRHDELAFRAEVCLLRGAKRGAGRSG